MIIEPKDVLRKIYDNIGEDIGYRFFSPLAEAGIIPEDLADRPGYIEKGTLLAGIKGNASIQVDVRQVLAETWESIAYFEFNGQRVCERQAFGKPMLALDEEFFKQGDYEAFVEESLLASRGNREVVVDGLSEGMASSIMRDFIKWRENGGK